LIQSKESFRAAYLGAGGSLAMVELEREVGGGQDERGADVYGRGRGGSSRMKHRSEEGGGSSEQRRMSNGGAWARAASQLALKQAAGKQRQGSGQQQKSNARQSKQR
jgi:hypothetical protein